MDEDGEVKSISDAGSIDDIDSDHEVPKDFENPMTQMSASAMSALHVGEHDHAHFLQRPRPLH